ncbi:MAG: toluene monooxygenase [Rhodocyclaceae bacterium]|nr:MAG: toluene monooxygenase [Rhodocyclaceae bacterium]
MSQSPELLKPLKTWSHLAGNRRRPSEYEIVSTNLHFSTDNPDAPFELDPNFAMAQWFKKYRNQSAITHPDWNSFRDPDEIVYRTYNLIQDGQETYVFGLFDQFSDREHDKALSSEWSAVLAKLYTPGRYLWHALQMMSAYVCQMAPASTISNCATYQAADHLRWLTHTAYRTTELSKTFPGAGFGSNEQACWEKDAAWQGIRELMEKALVTWDWAESFVALNLVAKPAVEEATMRSLGEAARHNGDTLLGLLIDAQMADAARHRKWAAALVKKMIEQEGNRERLVACVNAWMPLAEKAIGGYCKQLPDVPDAAAKALDTVKTFHRSIGL